MQSVFAFRSHFKGMFVVPKNTYAAIDGMRALGMFTVIVGHTAAFAAMGLGFENLRLQIDRTPDLFGWVWNVHFMVDLFFMLSGFLIASLLIAEYEKKGSIQVKRFYIRRFLRLMPVYLVVIGLFYLLNIPNSENLWWNLLYINNFFDHGQTAAPWTWSLAVEEQFYLVFPLLFIYLSMNPKQRFPALIGLYILSLIIRTLVLLSYPEIYQQQLYGIAHDAKLQNLYFTVLYDNLYTRFGGFICGITAAYLYSYYKESTRRFFNETHWGKVVIGVCLATALALFLPSLQKSSTQFPDWFVLMYHIFSRNIWTAVVAVIMLAILYKNPITRVFGWLLEQKIWYAPAQLTYSAYLIHPIWVGITIFGLRVYYHNNGGFDFSDPVMLTTAVTITTVFTYFFSCILYVFVERPLIVYRNNLTYKNSFTEENKELNLSATPS